jgi:CheY-like chemotaxis protein
MDAHPLRILLIGEEDNYVLASNLLKEVDVQRFTLDWVDDYDSAERMIERADHDLYLLDCCRHRRGELLLKAMGTRGRTPLIAITSHDDRETGVRAMKAGAVDYLMRDQIDAPLLERSIRYALERKRLEEELRSAQEMAQSAFRAKTQLVANLNHDIRIPMTGVLGMMDLLLETELSEQQRSHLEMAAASARSLLALLNDILDPRLELNSVSFSIRDCIEDAVKPLTLQAQKKGVRLTTAVDWAVPPVLVGDPIRLRQVLRNLAGHAIEVSDGGSVSVTVESRRPNESEVVLAIQVGDTGIGIASTPGMNFDSLHPADGPTTSQQRGVSLGLTISAHLVEMMGGTIRVQSEVGAGSTFQFDVCLAMPESRLTISGRGALNAGRFDAGHKATQQEKRSLRILLVEDNLVNQKVAAGLLRRRGHEVVVAVNGLDAVEVSRHQKFDLILMDIQMPKMDGFEATAAIRQIEEKSGRRTPIVALTAHNLLADKERCIQAGMDDYLSKPLNVHQLAEVLVRWSRKRGLGNSG